MRCTLIAVAAATASLAYQALATCPTGTDTYQVTMSDSYGDGWSGNYININNCTGGSLDPAHLPMTLDSGSLAEKYVCLPEGDFQYDLSVGGGTWKSEISWEIYEPGCSSADDDCSTLWHHDESEGDDYMYNTCPTPAPTACDGEMYSVFMSDSWGDGWGTSTLRIYDCLGELLKGDITLEDGHNGTQEVCLAKGTTTFQVECGGSSYFEYEISWSISNKDGTEVLSGGAPVTIAAGTAPSLCQSCKAAGGANVTVLVNHAHVEDGGEWYDAKADAFVAVAFDADGTVLLTSVIDDSNNPTWDQYLYFGCVFPGLSMKVLVYDYDYASSNDLLVSAEWTDWEEWPQGEIKRLNDTRSTSSNAYKNEYFVEVAYYKGEVPVQTYAPSPAPSVAPMPKPTSTPGTPTRAPTKKPVHTYDDDRFKNLDDDKFNGKDDDDDDKASSGGSVSSAGAVVGWVFGLLALVATCGGGWYWVTQQAAKRGHDSAWAWANASVVDPYSPMGSASMESAPSGLTLEQLRSQHANAVSPIHTATSTGGFASAKTSSLGGKSGSSSSGAYMPPVLATAMEDEDDEEEEVAIGGVGKYSASV